MELKTAAIAGLLGLSSRRINQLEQEGIAVRIAPGTFDAPATIQNYVRHVSGKAGSQTANLDLNAEKARLAKEQADGQEIKNAQSRGELLLADDVERTWSDACRRLRSEMLAVTGRVRAATGLEAADAAVLDREIRDALTVLSGGEDDPGQGAEESPPAA